MKLLKNKIFALIVCLVAFIVSGLIFADRVLGVSVQSPLSVANGINMNSSKIINLGTPTSIYDAATKSYVDTVAGGGGFWVDQGTYIYPKNYSSPTVKKFTIGDSGLVTAYEDIYMMGGADLMIWDGGIWIQGSGFLRAESCAVALGATTISTLTVNSNVDLAENGGTVAIGPHGCTAPNCGSSGDGDLRVSGDVNIAQRLTALGAVNLGTGGYGSNYNVYVNSDLYAYRNLTVSGSLSVYGSKNFVIDHPLDPENKKLVHSTLEGPEVAVFYRGEAQLQNGKAEIILPVYFEALTRKENRTVLLTPFVEFLGNPVTNLVTTPVKDGKFSVGAIDQNNPSQKFYWEVKAVRADIAPLEVERFKTDEERKADKK